MKDCILRGDMNSIRTGRYCVVGERTVIRPSYKRFSKGLTFFPVHIGDHVFIENVSILVFLIKMKYGDNLKRVTVYWTLHFSMFTWPQNASICVLSLPTQCQVAHLPTGVFDKLRMYICHSEIQNSALKRYDYISNLYDVSSVFICI